MWVVRFSVVDVSVEGLWRHLGAERFVAVQKTRLSQTNVFEEAPRATASSSILREDYIRQSMRAGLPPAHAGRSALVWRTRESDGELVTARFGCVLTALTAP